MRGNLAVTDAPGDETGDLELLRRQLITRARVALSRRPATGPQLTPRTCGPGARAEILEALNRDAQVIACLDPAARASEELAKRELATRPFKGPARIAMRIQREAEETLGLGVVSGKERAAA